MKVEKRDGSQERRIITAMIVDSTVLARIAPRWDKELFSSRWANLVGNWCVQYFNKYGKPPGKAIEGLFESWAATGKDKETVSIVESFLEGLSGEYVQLAQDTNTDYVLDAAANHFNRVKLTKLAESILGDIDLDQITEAQEKVNKFGRIEMGSGQGVSVLLDEHAIQQAFAEKKEPLIRYPGALGNFFSDAFERDGFIAFLGSEKRGKTWWLLDVAWRAMEQGKRVAFFEVGDMSQHQILRRFMTRAAKRPMKAELVKWPREITHVPGDASASVETVDHEFKKALDSKKAWAACKKIVERSGNGDLLQLSCHPNSTLSVAGMLSVLRTWERNGWIPDVIVVDYADILAPPSGHAETRDQINATWKQLRSLSQSFHCLMVTATQADAASYKADLLDRSNFSEDKRKFAHVTGMVGLNASKDEKDAGLMRLNWIVLRESEFSVEKVCHVAGCLKLANPAVRSIF